MTACSVVDCVPKPIVEKAARAARVHWGLCVSALAIEVSLLALHRYEAARFPVVPFVLHFLTAFVAYAAVLPLLFRRSPPSTGPSLSLILGCALLFRLTVLLIPPIWDDDLYRYLWDGRVGIHGINPYLYAPDAPELESLQDDHYDMVSFKTIRTIYPPLFQFLFQRSQWIAPSSLFFLKCLALFFDLALIAVLMSLLKHLGYPLAWILIYAWNPLPIKEFANSGHMDSLVLFLLFLSLRCFLNQRVVLAHLCLGLSVLAKLFSGIALPFLLIKAYQQSRRTFLMSLAAFGAVLFLGYAPYAEAGTRLLEGLSIYSRYWNFNAGPFRLIERTLQIAGWNYWWLSRTVVLAGVMAVMTRQLVLLRRNSPCRAEHLGPAPRRPETLTLEAPAVLIPAGGREHLAPLAKSSCERTEIQQESWLPSREAKGAEWSIFSLPQGHNRRSLQSSAQSISLLKAVFYSLAALVLLSPAVQPWYLCWLVPFYVFVPRGAWISLSGLVVLSYLFYLNFAEMAWPRLVEFGIPAAIASWEWARNESWQRWHTNFQT